jgi:hypothetical protein
MAAPDCIDRRAVVWGAVGVALVVALTLIGSFPLGMYGAATFAGLVHSVATGRRDRSRGQRGYASSPASA